MSLQVYIFKAAVKHPPYIFIKVNSSTLMMFASPNKNLPFCSLKQLLFIAFIVCAISSNAQSSLQQLDLHVQEYVSEQNKNLQDFGEYEVTSFHTSSTSGIEHFYLRQQYQGIPIHNAVMSVHILPDNQVLKVNDEFIDDVSSKVNLISPVLTASEALVSISTKQNYNRGQESVLISSEGNVSQKAIYSKGSISQQDIPVQLMYELLPNGSLRLSWDISIAETNTRDWWSMRVDAITGDILSKINWTKNCAFGEAACNEAGFHVHNEVLNDNNTDNSTALLAPDSYRVFPEPVESPSHGGRQLIVNPADAIASPFGWHDTDGVDGPEFTITRGNNVHRAKSLSGNHKFILLEQPDA